jgi:hypothetical protein
MLPEDTKKRRVSMIEDSLYQSQVHEHFDMAKPEDKPKVYTDEIFKEAAIRWLIETNQVRTAIPCLHTVLNIYDSLFRLSSIPRSKI